MMGDSGKLTQSVDDATGPRSVARTIQQAGGADVATIRKWVERGFVPGIPKRYTEPDPPPALVGASLVQTFTGFPPIVEKSLPSVTVDRVDEP